MINIEVKTERLSIVPRSIRQLEELCAGEADEDLKCAYAEMEENMKNLPGREHWGANWNICLSDGQSVGSLCFMGAPDENGAVELGYGIDEAYRGQGYAAEAAAAMARWALEQEGVSRVTAQTEESNAVSQKVLLKSGFHPAGRGAEGLLFQMP